VAYGPRAMPMELLTDTQVAGFGRFDGVPSRADLERFFFLDDADRNLLGDRRGDHNRLGLMLQATTVRYLGRFLEDPVDVPGPVVEYLAEQLGIADASCVKRYTDRAMTAYQHSWQIREAYGFRVFDDATVTAALRQFLDGRAWTHAEGPGALFTHAVGWLRRSRVLLPGITVLIRLVATVREAAAQRMHATLAAAVVKVDPALPGRLRASLTVPPGGAVLRDGVLAARADPGVGSRPGQGPGPGIGSGGVGGAGGGLFGGAAQPPVARGPTRRSCPPENETMGHDQDTAVASSSIISSGKARRWTPTRVQHWARPPWAIRGPTDSSDSMKESTSVV